MTYYEFTSNLLKLKPKLHVFALGLTSDREEAPDLVQDTYLKALTSRDKFVDFTNFNAWVFTIMKNTFINNYRRNIKKNLIFDLNQEFESINKPYDKGYISPESNYSVEEIEMSIESLDDDFRIPFRMFIEGYKYKEIAEDLGLKIGTVKSRIFLARQKLMVKLKDYST